MASSAVVSSSIDVGRPFRVSVEGNIGSGKSTFLEYCKQFDDVEVVPEPVSEWRNVNGTNLLENFYSDPERWASTFQSFVVLTTVQGHLRETPKRFKITERSIYSSRYCFLQNLVDRGLVELGMSSVLHKWYDFIEENFEMRPDAIVYIQTTPEIAFERMNRRGRGEEDSVPLEYLRQLDQLHNEWIQRETYLMRRPESTTSVFTLNGTLPLEELRLQYTDCLESLRMLTM